MEYNWQVKNNRTAKKIAENQLEADSLANCYLIFGPEGVGKEDFIADFVKIIRCQGEKQKPCNQCAACQKINKKSDPDIIKIKPKKGSISIKKIRKLKKKTDLKSYQAGKIVIIYGAEKLTNQAANSMLKMLEESKGKGKLIIILSASNYNFPQTVVSRAQEIHIKPSPLKIEKDDEKIVKYFKLTGLVGLNQKIENDKQYKKKINDLFKLYNQLKKSSLIDRLEAVNKKLVDWPISKLLYYLIIFERGRYLLDGDKKSLKNLKNLNKIKKLSRYNMNKKILLKNLFLTL